jgi:peroxiredoxin
LSSDSFLGKVAVVLLFIPDIGRPDYENRIRGYDDLLTEFGRLGCQVLGVARETAGSLREFVDVFDINLPILADASGRLAQLCGVVDSEGKGQWSTLIAGIDGQIRERRDDDTAAASHQAHNVVERVEEFLSDRPTAAGRRSVTSIPSP